MGRPDAILLLTASPEVLRRRLVAADVQRPQWLVDHLDLQCLLYEKWIVRAQGRFEIQDTSDIKIQSLAVIAESYFQSMIQ